MSTARAVVPWLLRWPLAGVLLFAAWSKLADPHFFAMQLAQYQILPAVGNQLVAVTLPWMEGVTGLCLLLGLWPRAAALIGAAMMTLFLFAAVTALARGLEIACGCFGTSALTQVGPGTMVLQVTLLAWSIALAYVESRRETLRATTT